MGENTKSYIPSNGTEGICFQERFCNHCSRDAAFRDTDYDGDPALGCQILANTMAIPFKSPDYPKEWIQDSDGSNPRCTAFTTDPTCPVRCDGTMDMFDAR